MLHTSSYPQQSPPQFHPHGAVIYRWTKSAEAPSGACLSSIPIAGSFILADRFARIFPLVAQVGASQNRGPLRSLVSSWFSFKYPPIRGPNPIEKFFEGGGRGLTLRGILCLAIFVALLILGAGFGSGGLMTLWAARLCNWISVFPKGFPLRPQTKGLCPKRHTHVVERPGCFWCFRFSICHVCRMVPMFGGMRDNASDSTQHGGRFRSCLEAETFG